MARFADISVSQGSVATYARWGGIFDIHLTAILLKLDWFEGLLMLKVLP